MSQQNKNTTQITRKLFEAKKKKKKRKKKHYLTQYQRQSKRNYRKHTPFLNGNIPSYVGKKEEYLNYCFESQENVLQYIVDLVYCIVIPYST